jgi:hypothetical protein
MSDQIRSAELLVNNALSSPQILKNLKDDPEKTLKELGDQAVRQLPPPSPATNDWLWRVLVGSFSLVFVVSGGALVWGMFASASATAGNLVKVDTVLLVFTTVLGYLAGLLSPSPLGKGKS